MAGHSHFKSIKHKKQLQDKKRSQIFSKLVREIMVAVKEGGSDPQNNPRLRLAVERAKDFNMPSENIERAIQKGLGKIETENLEEMTIEILGPGKSAIIVEAITDNKNRTLNEIKQIVNKFDAKIVELGALKWMFEKKGVVTVPCQDPEKKEELELKAIEAGASDFYWDQNILNVYTEIEKLDQLKENLKKLNIKIEESSLDWVPKEFIEINEKEKETCQRLFEALDENEAVQNIYFNFK